MSVRIFSGKFKGSVLSVPYSARPTLVRSRQSLFDILSGSTLNSLSPNDFFKDKVILDCFAGSGALGIEALSRGASFAYFVDICQPAISAIYENIQKLKLEHCCQIIKTDILKIRKSKEMNGCDIVFIDPPYGKVSIKKTIQHLSKTNWINKNTLIITEEDISKTEDLVDITECLIKRKMGKSIFKIAKLSAN